MSSPDKLPPPWAMLLIKLFNRPRYRKLRDARDRSRHLRRIDRYSKEHYIFQASHIQASPSFRHSGNAGDLIYSLPCVRALAGPHPARLRLALDVPLLNQELDHPLGGVMLNRRMLEMLSPLLLAQDYIAEVSACNASPVDYDLDAFRNSPLPLQRLNISRWYFYFHGVTADLSLPWLKVEPDTQFSQSIMLARSFRYRNNTLDYRLLTSRRDLVFVGLENEFLNMRESLPHLQWHKVDDFLQLARAIAGARLFIGNQSFPFALAEALKVPRILETDPLAPNVVPAGPEGYDVIFQEQFRQLLARLVSNQ